MEATVGGQFSGLDELYGGYEVGDVQTPVTFQRRGEFLLRQRFEK